MIDEGQKFNEQQRIIIIITIGKVFFCLFFLAIAFLTRLCQICLFIRPPGFHFFGFRNDAYFYGTRSPALRPTSNLEEQVPVFMAPGDRVAELCFPGTGSPFRRLL
jgi:hypothetical protein